MQYPNKDNNGLNSIHLISKIYGLASIHDISINGPDSTCNTAVILI